MKQLFESTKYNAHKTILSANDTELSSENFEEKVFQEFCIEIPILDKENVDTRIDEEIIGFGNAPEGISFRPGQKMDYALFTVPVIGSSELFLAITRYLYNDRKSGFDGRNVIYKEISQFKISGNDEIISNIKQNAKAKFDSIEKALSDFKVKADAFNEEELRPLISETIKTEREKRDIKGDSENKLNPFM